MYTLHRVSARDVMFTEGTVIGLLGFICMIREISKVNGEISSVDQKAIFGILSNTLIYLPEENRTAFAEACLKTKKLCSQDQFGDKPELFHWRPGITDADKLRFWQSYTCLFNEDLTLCPVDGDWSLWAEWGECNVPCKESGNRTRTRQCNNPSTANKGKPCSGPYMDLVPCDGTCQDAQIETGMQEAAKHLQDIHLSVPKLEVECLRSHCSYETVAKYLDLTRRDRYWSHLICFKYKRACPVDGAWSEWAVWTGCTGSCGYGYTYRHRLCNQPSPMNGGDVCPGDAYQKMVCVDKTCAHFTGKETSAFTDWSEFGPCSEACDKYGMQETHRTCLLEKECVLDTDLVDKISIERPCYQGPCPQAGGWSEWSEWTDCSAVCGYGRHTRLRTCSSPFPAGGATCIGPEIQSKDCDGTGCSDQVFHDTITSKLEESNAITTEESELTIPHGDPYHKPFAAGLDHFYKGWSMWSACTHACGGGYRTRIRTCSSTKMILRPKDAGSANSTVCTGEVQQIQFCNVHICAVNGDWGAWLEWSNCDISCGNGHIRRYRRCDNPLPENGGTCIGKEEDTESCTSPKCVISASSWSDWSLWSDCSKPCGEGEKMRDRKSVPVSQTDTVDRHRAVEAPPRPVVKPVLDVLPSHMMSSLEPMTNYRKQNIPTNVPNYKDNEKAWVRTRGKRSIEKYFSSGPVKRHKRYAESGLEYSTAPCNLQACPISGDWANWAEWSDCSTSCGMGFHFRDRTCTDPAPLNNGKACTGHATETERCYNHPCSENEPAVLFNGAAYTSYGPESKPVRYLLIYLRFWAHKPSGTLIYRQRACEEHNSFCRHMVELSLRDGQPHLVIIIHGKTLEVSCHDSISSRIWNDLQVSISAHTAYIRLNDGNHYTKAYEVIPTKYADFDARMVVGAGKNFTNGFQGVMAILRINFKDVSLYQAPYWLGPGVPDKQVDITTDSGSMDINHPDFRGRHYALLKIPNTHILDIMVTIRILEPNGLILFQKGELSGSYIALFVNQGELTFCIACSHEKTTCEKVAPLQVDHWYYVSLKVDAHDVIVRMQLGNAIQLTCVGRKFQPDNQMYVGGAAKDKWEFIAQNVNATRGLVGNVDKCQINGEVFNFQRSPLFDLNGVLNSMGFSIAAHVTEVLEHADSLVTLRCDYSIFFGETHRVSVQWLQDDSRFNASEGIYSTPQVEDPVTMNMTSISTLRLMPELHADGLYACVVNQDGRLIITHAFSLQRDIGFPGLALNAESAIIIAVVVLSVSVFICAITVCILKKDSLSTIVTKYKEDRVNDMMKLRNDIPGYNHGEEMIGRDELHTDTSDVEGRGTTNVNNDNVGDLMASIASLQTFPRFTPHAYLGDDLPAYEEPLGPPIDQGLDIEVPHMPSDQRIVISKPPRRPPSNDSPAVDYNFSNRKLRRAALHKRSPVLVVNPGLSDMETTDDSPVVTPIGRTTSTPYLTPRNWSTSIIASPKRSIPYKRENIDS